MVEALVVEQAAWLTPTSLFLLLNIVIATILVSSAFQKKPSPPQHHHSSTVEPPQPAANPPPPPAPLARTPSLFSRVTSFNFNNYYPYNNSYHEEHQHQYGPLHGSASAPSLFSRVASFNFSGSTYQSGPDAHVRGETEEEEVVADAVAAHARVDTPTPPAAAVARAPSLLSRVASFTLGQGPQVEDDDDVDARRGSSSNNNVNRKVSEGQEEENKGVVKKTKKKKKKGVVAKEMAPFKRDEIGPHEVEVDAKADDFINKFKQQLKLQRMESLMRHRSA